MKRSFRARECVLFPIPRVALWASMSCSFGAKSTLKNSLITAVSANSRVRRLPTRLSAGTTRQTHPVKHMLLRSNATLA